MSGNTYTEDDFSLVILAKVHPEKALPSDIYIKVDGKFLKFRSKNDLITPEKYDLFISKGVKNIYILNDDVMNFLTWLNKEKEEEEESFVSEAGEGSRDFFLRTREFKEKIYEVYFEEELDEEIIDRLQDNVENFVSEIKENPMTAKAIAMMLERNSTVADHSVNTANLAIFIAMALGHCHQFVLENLYMGAIFHDYGKLKVAPEILENKTNRMYSQAIQDHPMIGAKMLSKMDTIPPQVLSIVQQHHEQFNGHGFPKGLSGDEIYDLAQIVSMANIFDETLSENKHLSRKERYKRAYKVMEYDNGKNWSPAIMPRVLEALRGAFLDQKADKAA